MSYHGWKNRETWLVNLWFGDFWESAEDVECSQIDFEEQLESLPDWARDFIDDGSIDWEELKRQWYAE